MNEDDYVELTPLSVLLSPVFIMFALVVMALLLHP